MYFLSSGVKGLRSKNIIYGSVPQKCKSRVWSSNTEEKGNPWGFKSQILSLGIPSVNGISEGEGVLKRNPFMGSVWIISVHNLDTPPLLSWSTSSTPKKADGNTSWRTLKQHFWACRFNFLGGGGGGVRSVLTLHTCCLLYFLSLLQYSKT